MFAVGTAVQACELRIGIWDEGCEHGCIIEVTVAVAGVIGTVCRAFEYQCAEQVRDANPASALLWSSMSRTCMLRSTA